MEGECWIEDWFGVSHARRLEGSADLWKIKTSAYQVLEQVLDQVLEQGANGANGANGAKC